MEFHTWVWAMTRMTVQYFFMTFRSFSISFLPISSAHFLEDLVKAFFLERYLHRDTHKHTRRREEKKRGGGSKWGTIGRASSCLYGKSGGPSGSSVLPEGAESGAMGDREGQRFIIAPWRSQERNLMKSMGRSFWQLISAHWRSTERSHVMGLDMLALNTMMVMNLPTI